MTTQRPLTDDEKAELAALNDAVTQAIETRRIWLDTKMAETSRLQVGDDIYDIGTGALLGKVVALYRFWADRDDGIRDKSVSCHYEYTTIGGSHDNTSRQMGRSFGTREDALEHIEWLRGTLT